MQLQESKIPSVGRKWKIPFYPILILILAFLVLRTVYIIGFTHGEEAGRIEREALKIEVEVK